MSESRSSSDAEPRSRAPSAGANRRTRRTAARASGTFSRNSACQPTKPTSSPPTTGPDGGRGGVGHLDPAQRPAGLHVRLLRQGPDHHDGARVRGRRAQGHDGAGHTQHREVRRQRSQRAGHGHQDHAQLKQAPRSEPVGQPAHQRLPRRGGEVKGGDHPGDGGDVEPEVLAQHHQGDGDHRGVQRVQSRAQAESGDGQASPGRVAHGNSLSQSACQNRTERQVAAATGRLRRQGRIFCVCEKKKKKKKKTAATRATMS